MRVDSEGRELSEAQQEFFKDSKVRDEEGRLLTVYHGSDKEFFVFDRTKARANMDIQGSFFSPWEIDAQGYGGKVGEYYLNIVNPASEAMGYKALKKFQGQNGAGIKAREYLQSLGYDGVNNGGEEYIAFESNQIKSVTNQSPTENPDIRYSMRAEAHKEIKKAITDKNYGYDIQLTDSSPKIILGREGVRNLPLLMKASHVRENILTESEAKKIGARINSHTHYHGLGEKLFSDVINDLENVNEAYRGTRKAESPERRENYFLLISTHSDKDGNTINVPVFINEHGLYNRVYMDTNKVATVFGRENLREYIIKEVRNGNLVRIKNKSTVNSESPALIAVDYTDNALQEQYTQNEAKSQQISEKNNEKSVIDDLGKIQYQLRIEDKNRLDILDKQETRLTADLKAAKRKPTEQKREPPAVVLFFICSARECSLLYHPVPAAAVQAALRGSPPAHRQGKRPFRSSSYTPSMP